MLRVLLLVDRGCGCIIFFGHGRVSACLGLFIISWLPFCDNVPVTCILPILFPLLCDSIFFVLERPTDEFFFFTERKSQSWKDGV